MTTQQTCPPTPGPLETTGEEPAMENDRADGSGEDKIDIQLLWKALSDREHAKPWIHPDWVVRASPQNFSLGPSSAWPLYKIPSYILERINRYRAVPDVLRDRQSSPITIRKLGPLTSLGVEDFQFAIWAYLLIIENTFETRRGDICPGNLGYTRDANGQLLPLLIDPDVDSSIERGWRHHVAFLPFMAITQIEQL